MLCRGVETGVALSVALGGGRGALRSGTMVEGEIGAVMVRAASVGRESVSALEAVSAYGER